LRLVEEALDLDPPPTNAVRLVPVELRLADLIPREPDERDALEFAPATLAIPFASLLASSELPSRRDRFDLSDLPEDLEAHAREVNFSASTGSRGDHVADSVDQVAASAG